MCIHRETNFQVRCPDCEIYYDCRRCHDLVNLDHRLNVRLVKTIKCKICYLVGPVGEKCCHCGKNGGEYICLSCMRFDKIVDGIFHCESCNVCDSKEKHKCISLLDECSICMNPFSDILQLYRVKCGHFFHIECIGTMFDHDGSLCPLCRGKVRIEIPCDMCQGNITSHGRYAHILKMECGHNFHPVCFPTKNIKTEGEVGMLTCAVCGHREYRKSSIKKTN